MKKISNLVLISLTILIMLGCSISEYKSIYNEKTEDFTKELKFDEFIDNNYIVSGSIIHPFFRDLQTNSYSGHLGAFANSEGYEYMKVYKYNFTYFENGSKREISDTPNSKVPFKENYRGDLKIKYPYAGITLFSDKSILVDNKKPITLQVELGIVQNGKEEKKTISYFLNYRKDKYQFLNIKGW